MILTCAALLGGSLRPKTYATGPRPSAPLRRITYTYPEEKTIGSISAIVDVLRKSDKRRRRETREGKEKHMRFAATRCWEMTVKELENEKEKRLVGFA
jgi:hypothetical protein